MPSTTVSADGGAMSAAAAILHRHRVALDAARLDAERELIEHARSRREIEALIERLISRLDEQDAPDEDLEDFDEGDALDELGELDPAEHDFSTQPETYGRGWQADQVSAARGERLFTGSAVGVLAKWHGGRFAGVRAIAGEGRARP